MRGLKDYIPKIRRAFVNRLPTLVEEEREESTKRKKKKRLRKVFLVITQVVGRYEMR